MTKDEASEQPWNQTATGQLIAHGHGAGDILEAPQWTIVDQQPGLLKVRAHLPDSLKNPNGQLFGGFTPTYVDMVSLYTVHTLKPDDDSITERGWLTTINMRCDYFEPIVDDFFLIQGEVEKQRGFTSLVSTKFFQGDELAAHAITTIREIPNA